MVLRQSSLQLLRPVVEADIEGVLDLTDRNKNGNSNVSSFTSGVGGQGVSGSKHFCYRLSSKASFRLVIWPGGKISDAAAFSISV